MEKDKTVLILSCNCLSETACNGKTLLNLFREYPVEQVAQLYTHDEIPDFASSYRLYRITDRDMLRFRCKGGASCGRVITDHGDAPNDNSAKPHRLEHFKRLLRDILWHGTAWYERGAAQWVEEIHPDFIFFVGINNPYLYRLCSKIQDRYQIPVLIYNTDDYLQARRTLSPSFWIRLWALRGGMRRLMQKPNTRLITVNEEMRRFYKEKFGFSSQLLTNYIASEFTEYVPNREKRSVVYIGNLMHNRWKSILKIAEALYRFDPTVQLTVYPGNSITDTIRTAFQQCPNLSVGPFLNKEEVVRTIRQADFVLHVESFAYADVCLARYSLSTKITEYAAYCKPILAYCPSDVASYRILRENDAALCMSNDRELQEQLQKMNDETYLKQIVKNAYGYFNGLTQAYDMENLIEREAEACRRAVRAE